MRAACDVYPGSLLPEPNARGAEHSCHLLRADEERGFFSRTLRSLRISQPHTGRGDNVCIRERLAVDPPTTIRRFRDEYPSPVRQGSIACCRSDYVTVNSRTTPTCFSRFSTLTG